MLSWPEWVHRRVDSLSLEHPTFVRRRVSVDFTLEERDEEPLAIKPGKDGPIAFVPLTLLEKRPLVNFDLSDEGGRTLPLLTRRRNGRLAASILVALAEILVSEEHRKEHGANVPEDLEQDLQHIAVADAQSARLTLAKFAEKPSAPPASRAWRSALVAEPRFMAMASSLSQNFVVTAPLTDAAGSRRIIKFAYDEPIDNPTLLILPAWLRQRIGFLRRRSPSGEVVGLSEWLSRGITWRAKSVVMAVPTIAFGASYHFEVAAPDGLELTYGELIPHRSGSPFGSSHPHIKRRRQRMHLNIGSVPSGTVGHVLVNLRPASSTIVRAACLTAALTTVFLVLMSLFWENFVDNLGATQSLLLLVPAAIAGFVARPGEHSVTTQLLFGLRILALSSGLWAFCSAVVLLAGRNCETNDPGLLGGILHGAGTQTCTSWSGTQPALDALAFCSLVTFLVLGFTLWRIQRPPEQR